MNFRCPECDHEFYRKVDNKAPGYRVRCPECGNVVYTKPKFLKPPELKEYQARDLTGQPVEFMTCDRCGKRFNKRLALYAEGVIFCPGCYGKYELLVDEPKPQPMPRKYSSM